MCCRRSAVGLEQPRRGRSNSRSLTIARCNLLEDVALGPRITDVDELLAHELDERMHARAGEGRQQPLHGKSVGNVEALDIAS